MNQVLYYFFLIPVCKRPIKKERMYMFLAIHFLFLYVFYGQNRKKSIQSLYLLNFSQLAFAFQNLLFQNISPQTHFTVCLTCKLGALNDCVFVFRFSDCEVC